MQDEALPLPREMVERVEKADIAANVSKSTLLLSEIVHQRLQEYKEGTQEKLPMEDIDALGMLSDIFVHLELNQ